MSLYYLYVISILLLYYIYIIVRNFFASDTPYLRIFTPNLTHLIDFLTHQVRIFCISRWQIHAPAFPSKTSFQHFITSVIADISLLAQQGISRTTTLCISRMRQHTYHACVAFHITTAQPSISRRSRTPVPTDYSLFIKKTAV